MNKSRERNQSAITLRLIALLSVVTAASVFHGAKASPGDSFAYRAKGTRPSTFRARAARGDILPSTAQRLPRVHPTPRFLDLHPPVEASSPWASWAHISRGDTAISILTRCWRCYATPRKGPYAAIKWKGSTSCRQSQSRRCYGRLRNLDWGDVRAGRFLDGLARFEDWRAWRRSIPFAGMSTRGASFPSTPSRSNFHPGTECDWSAISPRSLLDVQVKTSRMQHVEGFSTGL